MPLWPPRQYHRAKTLLSGCLLKYVIQADTQVAFIIDTFSIADDQYLRRFMAHLEGFSYFIGDRTVVQQVQILELNVLARGL